MSCLMNPLGYDSTQKVALKVQPGKDEQQLHLPASLITDRSFAFRQVRKSVEQHWPQQHSPFQREN